MPLSASRTLTQTDYAHHDGHAGCTIAHSVSVKSLGKRIPPRFAAIRFGLPNRVLHRESNDQ
jgi:hypothetical protein